MSYSLLTRDELMALDLPPVRYLVDGMLIEGSATLLSGREKSGKGLLLIDIAVSVTRGEPFLGRSVSAGPVIYMALEENVRTVKERVGARDAGVGGYPLLVAPLSGFNDESFQLERPDDIQALVETIEEHRPVLVIIDTLREAHSGREDLSDDMAPRLRPIRDIAHQTNTCIILSHHMNKSGTSRGSTAILASLDDGISFTREDADHDLIMRGVLVGMGRELPKFVEHIAFDQETHKWVATGAPSETAPGGLREKILDVLDQTDTWMSSQELAEHLPDFSLKTVQNKVTDMKRERPAPFLSKGEGTKSNPYVFHGSRKRKELAPQTVQTVLLEADEDAELHQRDDYLVVIPEPSIPASPDEHPYRTDVGPSGIVMVI